MAVAKDAPPTEHQLERLQELIEHPAVKAYVDDMDPEKFGKMIETRGGAGVLIGMMKKKIAKA